MSQEMGVLHRLNSPVVSTYLDTEAITFQRYHMLTKSLLGNCMKIISFLAPLYVHVWFT